MSSKGDFSAHVNSADRRFFLHHRDNPSHDIFIGPPIRSRSTGEWVLTVSRRFENAQGEFGGAIIVTLGIENFLDLFGKIDIGKQGVIALATARGQLLVRYPFREQNMGQDYSRSPNFLRYFSGLASGTATFHSGIDGTERLYAFRRNDRYPVFTTVAQGKNEALSAWRRQALLTAGVVLSLLAAIMVIGWRLIQANGQLQRLATQDALTGLANRRHFDDALAREFRRAAREAAPLSLLLVDLDHFKRFNDSYGHVAGDACLKSVCAQLALSAQRPGDLAARYGGEEMGIILPHTDLAGAMHIARQLQQRIQALDIAHRASLFGRVTVSIGIATLQGEPGPRSPVELVEAADRALYRAKAAGRNRSEY
jgi:diguanylate cyclase (GGDEF)-like protein